MKHPILVAAALLLAATIVQSASSAGVDDGVMNALHGLQAAVNAHYIAPDGVFDDERCLVKLKVTVDGYPSHIDFDGCPSLALRKAGLLAFTKAIPLPMPANPTLASKMIQEEIIFLVSGRARR